MAELTVRAHEDGTPVDFTRLRRQRRERVLEAMERDQLDVLLLGREANVRYVSGSRRLWLAGTRAFGPGCVVVRTTGEVHLLTTGDEGVPGEIPHEHLFPLSWNPVDLVGSLGAIDGVGTAGRIGVDGMSSTFAQLLPRAAPDAELVDATPTLHRVRATKLDDEVACLRTALAITEGALERTRGALAAGVAERELAGRFAAAMAAYGVTQPALQGTFCAVPRRHEGGNETGGAPLRRLPTDRRIEAGEAVAAHAGVVYAGYEGALARTWVCPAPSGGDLGGRLDSLRQRCSDALEALVAACRPGATAADLRAAYERTGAPLPPLPLAHGIGVGVEPPLVGTRLDGQTDGQLTAGMVLALHACAFEDGVGGWLDGEVVHLTDEGPVRLTGATP